MINVAFVKPRSKALYNKNISRRNYEPGQKVLLYNSLDSTFFSSKLRS